MTKMHTLQVTKTLDNGMVRTIDVGVHFNGAYYQDDGNNIFLGRASETDNWFIYVRSPHYASDERLAELNALIVPVGNDYGFALAWVHYLALVKESYRR